MKDKEKSLLEIAIDLLGRKQKPQRMSQVIREVMEIKGLKADDIKAATPQFILDFMQSGYFVYCGDDCWDLKERQATNILDKDGHDYEDIYFDDEDVKKNELKDETIYASPDDEIVEEDTDDEDDENEEEDDLASEFDDISSEFEEKGLDEFEEISTENTEEESDEDEEEDLSDEFKEDNE